MPVVQYAKEALLSLKSIVAIAGKLLTGKKLISKEEMMIRFCLKKWDDNKNELEKVLLNDTGLNSCDYLQLVKLVTAVILNGGNDDIKFDPGNITEINNGDWQGTLLYLVPFSTYQPSEAEYLMTYVGYGSCSGCDTLQAIQNWSDEKLNAGQVKDYMLLCKDILCNMIRPYNTGWRVDDNFETVEVE